MMHKPLYREALGKSWRLVWDHKVLWVYGLFAAFLGQLGILELVVNTGYASSDYALYPNWLAIPKFWSWSMLSGYHLAPDQMVWALLLCVMLLGLFVVMVFVIFVSQGALIKSVAQSTKRGSVPDVGKAWHVGVAHFWRLFFIQVCKKIVVLFTTVIVGWATLNVAVEASTKISDILVFFAVFLLAILVGAVVSFIGIYAACYVVVEEYPLFKALEAGWLLFWEHWLVSLEVGVIILVLNVAVGVIAIIAFFLCFLPTIALWTVAAATLSQTLFVTAFAIGIVLFVLSLMFLGSVFTVYTTATWTYLYMKMHKDGVGSRLMHWLR